MTVNKKYYILITVESLHDNFIYLFINYNTIINYILIIYELGVVSQTRVSGGNRTDDPNDNSLAHCLLDYQATLHDNFKIN